MRQNLGWVFKQAINEAIRKERMSPGAGIILSEDASTHEPSVNIPVQDLASLKTRLQAETDGASGADYIGITPIVEIGAADTVQEALEGIISLLLNYAEVYRETFDRVDGIVVTHNLRSRPIVQIIGQVPVAYGAGNYGDGAYGGIDDAGNAVLVPSSIVHDSINQVTVTLSAAAIGEVVCIG